MNNELKKEYKNKFEKLIIETNKLNKELSYFSDNAEEASDAISMINMMMNLLKIMVEDSNPADYLYVEQFNNMEDFIEEAKLILKDLKNEY